MSMSLKYEIALINVWWEEQGTDTRYFEGVEEQTQYFETKASGLYSTFSNFNMGDNINTTIIYKCPQNLDINTLVASNYAVVRRTNEDNTFTYRYFFATCEQDSNNQIRCKLSLDDIQTNYFRYKARYGDCFIRRAHLDRFDEIDADNKVRFNLNKNSKLFNKEPFDNISKRLVSRQKINYKIDSTPNSKLNKWLNDNVAGWNYVFIDPRKSYKFYSKQGTDVNIKLPSLTYRNGVNGVASVICVPLIKESKEMYIYNTMFNPTISINATGFKFALDFFRNDNNDTSYYYSNKISLKPPFPYKQYIENADYVISNDRLYLLGNFIDSVNDIDQTKINVAKTEGLAGLNKAGVCLITNDDKKLESETIELPYEFEFNVNDIVGSSRNSIYNPKLLSSDFVDLTLSDNCSSSFSYDVGKINNKNISIEYDEVLTPDITKGYSRIKFTNQDDVYIPETGLNMTGLVSSNDTSLPYDNGQMAQMLANNKNFYMQTNMEIATSAIQGLLNVSKGNYVASASTGISLGTNIANKMFAIDNMKNAPSQMKNSSGNATLQISISDIANYLEIYESLDFDKKKADDFMFMNGYSVGVHDNINTYTNIRKLFNYIECDLEVITAPISNKEKQRIKLRFANGIRFWNTDSISYTNENYERRLENNE